MSYSIGRASKICKKNYLVSTINGPPSIFEMDLETIGEELYM
jgi:hypothetical protein